jgi:hypothetical protein
LRWQNTRERRIIDLVKVKSRAALIVFAASLSGLGQATIGNDILGFSYAVLEAGTTAYMSAFVDVRRCGEDDLDGSVVQEYVGAAIGLFDGYRAVKGGYGVVL